MATTDLLLIDELASAAALLKPARLELLKLMAEPRTCNELAEAVGSSPQQVYYHVKALERGGLVTKVRERRVRGVVEGFYQAKARAYWLSPRLVGRIGGRRKAQDQMSLAFLLSLAEQLQEEIGALAQEEDSEINSLGLSAQIELRDGADRAAFMEDVQGAFQSLAQKYGRTGKDVEGAEKQDSSSFRLLLACYPHPPE